MPTVAQAEKRSFFQAFSSASEIKEEDPSGSTECALSESTRNPLPKVVNNLHVRSTCKEAKLTSSSPSHLGPRTDIEEFSKISLRLVYS